METKKRLARAVCCAVAFMLVLTAGACEKNPFKPNDKGEYKPRHPWEHYDENVDSWLQTDPSDENYEITWFMDYAFSNPNITDLIERRTGVRINFINAMTDDHTELNTMIAGGKLPEVISIQDDSLRVQLAEEGYTYPLDLLARYYAPSMLKKDRISEDHADYYRASDGHLYLLSSDFYDDAKIQEFAEIGGNQYPNVDIIARKDYLTAFLDHKRGLDPSFNPDTYCTKPSGFLEMCRWVKQQYSSFNTDPTVLFHTFRSAAVTGTINYSLTSLMDFMGVPYEDGAGNYMYQYATPEFVKVIEFMNTLYNDRLVISPNLSWDGARIDTEVLNGKPFVVIGGAQLYKNRLAQRELNGYVAATDTIAPANEYVGIVLTNENGDAPLLKDYAGRGYRMNMITKNCAREDRVIKVFDYMMSEQGMREMMYGETEGDYYTFKIRPGEINPRSGKPSTYGTIELTDKHKALVSKAFTVNLPNLGLNRMHPLINRLYQRMVSERDDYASIQSPGDWTEYKVKKTYFGYTFSNAPYRFPLDTSDRAVLNNYADWQADVERVWIEALPKMIQAANSTAMRAEYDKALALSYQKGANELIEFRNRCFKANKAKMGIEWVWPRNDPNYVAPPVKLFGFADQYAQRPSYVYK